jgi:hypothetical protein
MAQQNKMEISNRIVSNRRSHRSPVTTLEKLAPGVIFEIFNYLTANQIYFSFFGLSSRMNELVYIIPNIYFTQQQNFIAFSTNFSEQNFASIKLTTGYVDFY